MGKVKVDIDWRTQRGCLLTGVMCNGYVDPEAGQMFMAIAKRLGPTPKGVPCL